MIVNSKVVRRTKTAYYAKCRIRFCHTLDRISTQVPMEVWNLVKPMRHNMPKVNMLMYAAETKYIQLVKSDPSFSFAIHGLFSSNFTLWGLSSFSEISSGNCVRSYPALPCQFLHRIQWYPCRLETFPPLSYLQIRWSCKSFKLSAHIPSPSHL